MLPSRVIANRTRQPGVKPAVCKIVVQGLLLDGMISPFKHIYAFVEPKLDTMITEDLIVEFRARGARICECSIKCAIEFMQDTLASSSTLHTCTTRFPKLSRTSIGHVMDEMQNKNRRLQDTFSHCFFV
jgi:hypothetical protein